MPIYEYVCQDCGTRFDSLRSMKDADSLIECKSCQGKNTRRALSVFFASSQGKPVSGMGGSGHCSSCNGGHCESCGH